MERAQLEITLSAEALSLGETVRTHCPTCQGSDPTLTITRQEDGSVVWNCYRASCEERGGRGGHRIHSQKRSGQRKQKFTPYSGDLRHLTEEEMADLEERIDDEDEPLID